MPLTKFKCPEGTPSAGRENEFEHCIKRCEYQCMPAGVLYATWLQNRDNVHRGDMISPTALPRCPRKLILTRTEDYAEEPPALYDAVRGTLVHSFLECDGLEGMVSEKRLYKTIDVPGLGAVTISGQIDGYEAPRKKLHDYKTTDIKSLYYMGNKGIKSDHLWQLSTYAWLMDGGRLESADGEQVFWPVETAQLHFLTMRQAFSTGDEFTWVVDDRSPNRGNPFNYEVSRKQVQGRTGWSKWEIRMRLPEVKLKPFEEVEAYIRERVPELVKGFREPAYIPPGVMSDADQNWECGFCPVKARCDEIENQKSKELQLEMLWAA